MKSNDAQNEQNKNEVALENQNQESTTTIIEKCKHAQDAQIVAGDEVDLKFNTVL